MPNEDVLGRELSYSAPLISNIRQILTGLQGFDSMALEIIQNADDAGAKSIWFDITEDELGDEITISERKFELGSVGAH